MAAQIFKEALPEAVKFLSGDLQYKSIYIGRLVRAAWNVVQSLVFIKEFDEAIVIAVTIEQVAGDQSKAQVLDGIAQALVKTQQFERAIEVVEQIRNSQDRMETLVKVTCLFEEQGSYSINLSNLKSLFRVARSVGAESVLAC